MRLYFSPSLLLAFVFAVFLLAGADGCSSSEVTGAKLYINQEDYDAALANLERELATNPDNVEALELKARVHFLQSESVRDPMERRAMLEMMTTALDRAEALNPESEEVATLRLASWANEMNAGQRSLQQSGGDESGIQNAVRAFENAVYVQPDSTIGYFNLGLAQYVAGETEAAIPSFERAIAGGEGTADTYRYLGGALMATDQGTRAVEVLEEGADAFPDDEAITAELLNAYARTGRSEQALARYDQLVQASPDNPLYRYNYGSTLLQLERFDEAIAQLTVAAELNPDDPNVVYNLGAAYQNKAANVSEQIRTTEDNDEAMRLRGERDALLMEALPHLENARDLLEAGGEDASDICQALFQIYVPLGREDDARDAGECAGMDMN